MLFDKTLGEEVNAALFEVRDRLWNFYKYQPYTPNKEEAVNKVLNDVLEECQLDFRRNSTYDISRHAPVSPGTAINLLPQVFTGAKIWMIDSSTRFGLHVLPKLEVNAKAFRSYMPNKGHKNDRAYFSLVQSSMNADYKDKDIAKEIIDFKFDENGMFDHPSDKFNLYAPKVCLVYSNIHEEHRAVLMLRPSSHKVARLSYRAYCYVVMSSLMKRISGSCYNFSFWNMLDDQEKMSYHQSMIITDNMLVVKADELVRYPLIHKMIDVKKFGITSNHLFPMAA